MAAVPLLALAGSWQVAALLIIAERVGKATRNPPRDAMLSHAAREMGYGWGFGVHEALDQFGAMFGPLLVALILAMSQHDYKLAFAALAVPAAITLTLVLVARRFFPRPQDLAAGPAEVTTVRAARRVLDLPDRRRAGRGRVRRLLADLLPLLAGAHGVGADRAGVLRRRNGGQRHRLAHLRAAVRQGRDRRADPADHRRGGVRTAGVPRRYVGRHWQASHCGAWAWAFRNR